jgi:hypothetical protein
MSRILEGCQPNDEQTPQFAIASSRAVPGTRPPPQNKPLAASPRLSRRCTPMDWERRTIRRGGLFQLRGNHGVSGHLCKSVFHPWPMSFIATDQTQMIPSRETRPLSVLNPCQAGAAIFWSSAARNRRHLELAEFQVPTRVVPVRMPEVPSHSPVVERSDTTGCDARMPRILKECQLGPARGNDLVMSVPTIRRGNNWHPSANVMLPSGLSRRGNNWAATRIRGDHFNGSRLQTSCFRRACPGGATTEQLPASVRKRHASVGLAPAVQQLSSYRHLSANVMLPSGLPRRCNN